MDYYKFVGHADSTNNWTTEIVLEVNDAGEPKKVLRLGEPVQISVADRERLEDEGYAFVKSSASEAKEVAESDDQPVGSDIVGAAPLLNTPQPPQGSADKSKNDK